MPAFALAANSLGGLTASLSPALAERALEYVDRVNDLLHPEQFWLEVVGIVSVCVTAPLLEEFAFRGALLSALRDDLAAFATRTSPRLAGAAACALNGLAFGAVHMSWLSMLPLTLFGTYLAHLTLRARSIWPAVFAHAAFNTFNALVFPMFVEPSAEVSPAAEAAVAAAVTGAIAAAAWWISIRLATPSTLDAPAPSDA